MADKSDIGWTGATWNIITGCEIKSPACRICYAMDLAGTRLKNHPSRKGLTKEVNGRHVWTGEVRFNEGWLLQPLQWKRPREIFVIAHGDLFYEKVPDEWIDQVFAVMALAHWHTFQLLTKRSDRMREYMNQSTARGRQWAQAMRIGAAAGLSLEDRMATSDRFMADVLPNVHGGVSAEDQKRADERIPDLIASPFVKRFVSAEPLLGPIDLIGTFARYQDNPNRRPAMELGRLLIDQVITGGESGRGKRNPLPSHVDWFRSIRDQCAKTGIAYFHKQNGSWIHDSQLTAGVRSALIRQGVAIHPWPDSTVSYLVGTKAAGNTLDWRRHEERP